MSETEFFAAQQIEAGNPLRPYGVSRLITGAIYVVAGFLVLGGSVPAIRRLFSGSGDGVPLDVTAAILRALVAVFVVIAGIIMVSRGIGGVSRLIVPPRAPLDLDAGELKPALIRREMPAYAVGHGDSYWLLRHWFPNQFPLMTLYMRRLVASGLREVTGLGVLLVLVAFVVFGVGVLPPDVTGALGSAAPKFPILFFIVLGLGAATHLMTALRAMPSMAPRAEVAEFRSAIRGGGDPSHLAHGLEHELGAIRPEEGTPNRSMREGFALGGGGVADSGQFQGVLMVENQPEVVDALRPAYTFILLVAGSLLQLAAFWWWFRLPRFEGFEGAGVADSARLVMWIISIFGGVLVARMGGRMIGSAREVLNTFRFRSVGVVLDVKGNFARSQVRVGKGIHDSIESENLVVRSDCSVAGHVATLLTESRGLMGPRSVVAMVIDDEARHVERLVTGWLERFESQAATIVGVDLKDKKLVEMVQANIALDGQRTSVRALASTMPPEQLAGGTSDRRALNPADEGDEEAGGASSSRPKT